MKTRNFFCFLLITLSILVTGCKSESEKKQELIFSIKENLCSDIRTLVRTSINSFTLGLGGSVYETVVSKSQQKQMFCDPISPYVIGDLNELTNEELEKIQQNSNEKAKFILRSIVSHKDEVKKAYDTYQPELKKYTDMLLEYVDKNSK